MHIYQPVSSSDMLRFARQEPGAPRCIRCGQPFHMFFSRGQLIEQHCGCGLVYRVETMVVQEYIDGGTNVLSPSLDG
jgi:hypothetical protein